MTWYKVSNSNNVQPSEVETSKRTVFVRRNFTLVAEKSDGINTTPSHYEYEECKMTKSEYDLYSQNIALRDYIDMIS